MSYLAKKKKIVIEFLKFKNVLFVCLIFIVFVFSKKYLHSLYVQGRKRGFTHDHDKPSSSEVSLFTTKPEVCLQISSVNIGSVASSKHQGWYICKTLGNNFNQDSGQVKRRYSKLKIKHKLDPHESIINNIK